MRAIFPITSCTNGCCRLIACAAHVRPRLALGFATMVAAPPMLRGDAAAKKHYRILCARAEPRWRFCVAPWALPRNQKVSQQTKLGRVAESLRLTGKGFVKCFSTLSFFFSQVAYSPSPLQRRSRPSAKTYERSSTWSQRLRCLIRNRCHETVRRRSAFGWSATQPQRDASVLQSDAGAMSISRRRAIEPRC